MNVNNSLSTLSIVIPVYNVNKYVIEAVDSVINQSFRPYEIIIVNDGSTDNSGELVEQHYGSLQYVKIIHTNNQGLGEARNVGAMVSTGDYIYYFDSDDVLEFNLVESFYNVLSNNSDLDIFAFSAESFQDDLAESPTNAQTKLPSYRREQEAIYSDGESAFNSMSKCEKFYPNAWLYIYNRRLHIQKSLHFKPIIHEDEEFTPRLFFSAGKTVVTDSVFFKRRVRSGSIMQSARSEKNAVGYLRSIETLNSLIPLCKYEESRRYLTQRITNNLLSVILIHKKNITPFSSGTTSDFKRALNQNNNLLLRLASFNFFAFRVARYTIRNIRFLFSR